MCGFKNGNYLTRLNEVGSRWSKYEQISMIFVFDYADIFRTFKCNLVQYLGCYWWKNLIFISFFIASRFVSLALRRERKKVNAFLSIIELWLANSETRHSRAYLFSNVQSLLRLKPSSNYFFKLLICYLSLYFVYATFTGVWFKMSFLVLQIVIVCHLN